MNGSEWIWCTADKNNTNIPKVCWVQALQMKKGKKKETRGEKKIEGEEEGIR